MARPTSSVDRVRAALRELCAEAPKPHEILFRYYFTAQQVAERAGVSVSTARKHLEGSRPYIGYRSARIHGSHGYRYDEPIGG